MPASSYHITAQFIHDGNIVTDVDHSLPASFFTISDGFHTVSASDPSPADYLNIGAVDSSGLPTEWFLGITSPYAPVTFPVDSWWLTTQNRSWASTTDGSYVTLYTAPGIGEITGHGADFDMPGVWSKTEAPVPEPATLLLLSSGLLGFAGFRKAQKRRRSI